MKRIWLYYITIILIILLFIYRLFLTDVIDKNTHLYNLTNDGVQVYKSVLNNSEIELFKTLCKSKQYSQLKDKILQHRYLQKLIKENLGSQYHFQDYIWIIEKSAVHTCHRDNNGDFFNPGQKHPSYTLLVYLEDMDKSLGIIPKSHEVKGSYGINFINNIVHLPCKKGDVTIFNANLIHVGAMNKKDDHLRIQLKVSHSDDLGALQYYENFNKVLNKENLLPVNLRIAQKNVSCMFPFISDLTQKENIRTSRGSDNGAYVGPFQKIFSSLFYGNSNFYDLPNAF